MVKDPSQTHSSRDRSWGVQDLPAVLGLGPKEHVTVVGGGGKTTLVFTLGQVLQRAGKRVITATTTKIRQGEARAAPLTVLCRSDPGFKAHITEGLRSRGHVFVGHGPTQSGKIEGIGPALADALFQDPAVDYLILEGDGAAGRPLKAHAAHEPVIPSSTTVVIALAGLEATGRPLDPVLVFRPGPFEEITGVRPGEVLTPGALCRLFHAPRGLFKNTPPSARRVAFLNKLDLLPDQTTARHLAGLLLGEASPPVDRVVVGSLWEGVFFRLRKGQ